MGAVAKRSKALVEKVNKKGPRFDPRPEQSLKKQVLLHSVRIEAMHSNSTWMNKASGKLCSTRIILPVTASGTRPQYWLTEVAKRRRDRWWPSIVSGAKAIRVVRSQV